MTVHRDLGLDDSQNGDKLNNSRQGHTTTTQGRTFIRQPQATPKQGAAVGTAGKISAETMTRKQEALLKNRLKNLVK